MARQPGRSLIIPPFYPGPDWAGPTLRSLQLHNSPVEGFLGNGQKPPENTAPENAADAKERGKRKRLHDIVDAQEQQEKRKQEGQARRLYDIKNALQDLRREDSSAEPPTKRNRTAVNVPRSAPAPAQIKLSQEQEHILKVVEDGHSVFFTGSAGTGKSLLLGQIIQSLKTKFAESPDAVAVTAFTGLAASQIGGTTINSFAGVGLGQDNLSALITRVKGNPRSVTRWKETKALIIDEISLIEGNFFDKLSGIGKNVRQVQKPFGGIQLVVTGDFFQLAPIKKDPKYAFEACDWPQAIQQTYGLTQVFRQRDQEFVEMLDAIRYGMLTNRHIEILEKQCSTPVNYGDGIEPTQLYPLCLEVKSANLRRLEELKSERHKFMAHDTGPGYLLDYFPAEPALELCIHAQVMLIKNISPELVNGLIGRVLGFVKPNPAEIRHCVSDDQVPLVEFLLANGQTVKTTVTREKWSRQTFGQFATRVQIPLTLAWALSIHKAQGQSLARVKIDLQNNFACGQAYVGLSRATSLDGLEVLNFTPKSIKAHQKVVKWAKGLKTVHPSTSAAE